MCADENKHSAVREMKKIRAEGKAGKDLWRKTDGGKDNKDNKDNKDRSRTVL